MKIISALADRMARVGSIACLLILTTTQAHAAGFLPPEFAVNTSVSDANVNISFATNTYQPSICRMSVRDVRIERPELDSLVTGEGRGLIAIEAEVVEGTICLQAFGPHSGEVVLRRDSQLPGLMPGAYDILVNGADYGTLVLDPKNPQWLPYFF